MTRIADGVSATCDGEEELQVAVAVMGFGKGMVENQNLNPIAE